MEQNAMVLAPHVLSLPFVYGKTSAKGQIYSQRSEKTETKENSQRRANNNKIFIKVKDLWFLLKGYR